MWGNRASGDGGAIFNEGDVFLTNDTFADNEALQGAAIESSGETTTGITSSILANSIKGGNCDVHGSLTSGGFNLSDDNSCHFSGSSLNNVANLNLDPAGLENNGGPT